MERVIRLLPVFEGVDQRGLAAVRELDAIGNVVRHLPYRARQVKPSQVMSACVTCRIGQGKSSQAKPSNVVRHHVMASEAQQRSQVQPSKAKSQVTCDGTLK